MGIKTPNLNQHITKATWQAARGELRVETKPNYCLRVTRQIVQNALEITMMEFYKRYRVKTTSRKPQRTLASEPWASDVEASMKKLKYQIEFVDRQAGDLIFSHNIGIPYGHVGILLDKNTVLEQGRKSIYPHAIKLAQNLVLTPIEKFPTTLIARLQ